MTGALQPAFIAGGAGRLFISCFAPAAGTDRWLLFVPPFAEEANKSRRMLARLGHALAERGMGLCLPDLYGTGDSAGDFGDARVDIWQDDIARTAGWLADAHGCRALTLGGLRLGVPLALSALDRLPPLAGQLFWQPVAKGQQQLTQFLRLRQAAAVMAGGKASLKDMQAALDAGETLEVAGYALHPQLAGALAGLDLAALMPAARVPLHWLELSRDPARPVTPVSRQVIDAWRHAGIAVQPQGVPGDPFWAVQELVDAPALIAASVDCLLGGEGA